jgi:hypothetical protein
MSKIRKVEVSLLVILVCVIVVWFCGLVFSGNPAPPSEKVVTTQVSSTPFPADNMQYDYSYAFASTEDVTNAILNPIEVSRINTLFGEEVASISDITKWKVLRTHKNSPTNSSLSWGKIYSDPLDDNNDLFFQGFYKVDATRGYTGYYLILYEEDTMSYKFCLLSRKLGLSYWDGLRDKKEQDALSEYLGYEKGSVQQMWPITTDTYQQLNDMFPEIPTPEHYPSIDI